MFEVDLDGACKTYPPNVRAVDDVTFSVAAGEYLSIVGPSGCGKTTLLRLIAGLETLTSGKIMLNGSPMNDVPASAREIAMLFQRPALVPNQSVRRNLAWAWTLAKPWSVGGRNHGDELTHVARVLELEQVLDRPVQNLSGGQQQRVALGRCLLRGAKLVLLDEPLGHLDAPLRDDLRRQIRAIVKDRRLTALHVTHDPEEALTVGDRVAVLQHGRLVQLDSPREIRRAPANRYVVELIHHQTGGVNFLPGVVTRDGMDTYFETSLGRWPMSVQIVSNLRESLCHAENFHAGEGKVCIMMGIAVEDVRCSTASDAGIGLTKIHLPVNDLEFGDEANTVIAGSAQVRWLGRAALDERFEKEQAVTMAFSLSRAYWFDNTTGRTLATPTG